MKKTAQEWVEELTRADSSRIWMSEELQALIVTFGGKYYKASNLERRARESDLVRSVSIPGKNYKGYQWAS